MDEQSTKVQRFLDMRKRLALVAKSLNVRHINDDSITWRQKRCNPHAKTDRYFDRKGQTIEWDERGNIKSITPGKWRSHTYYSLEYRVKQSRLKRVRTEIKKVLSNRVTDHIVVSVGKSALSRSDIKTANSLFHAQKHGRYAHL